MKIKLITIPNLLTLSNLVCGCLAAVAALVWNDLGAAFWLIVAAAVFDFFDGFAARLLHRSSPIGVELDSLADDISFGFAPAAVLFTLYAASPAAFAWNDGAIVFGRYALFVVAAFSALRLARFNVDTSQQTEFMGLPVPACALFCASLGILAESGNAVFYKETLLLAAVAMSWLLVSPIRMFTLKFHGFGWRGNELRYAFLGVCAVLVVLLRLGSVPVVILLYIAVSAVRWLAARKRQMPGNDA